MTTETTDAAPAPTSTPSFNAPQPAAPRDPDRHPAGYSPEYVKDLREENKGWRLKATEQEAARKAAEATAAQAAKDAEDKIKAFQEASAAERETHRKAADDRILRAELKASAIKAGMIDLDGLKLADFSQVKLNETGDVEGADALISSLKEAKPYLFGAVRTGTSDPSSPPPRNPAEPKKAKDMTPAEREAFLKEHRKKFG